MSSFINNDVLFSYQGSFGPPTYGHYKSMLAFAEQLSTEYTGNIKMFFMMSPGGSKKHLFPTIESRKAVLQEFCDALKLAIENNTKIINKKITFHVGDQEIIIAENQNKSVGTIETINVLIKKTKSEEYKNYNICLGMGLDNAYQLPYWANIDEYENKVHKIYVVPRNPTNEDIEKTRMFRVVNEDKSVAEMRFDVTVPWKNDTFLKCFLSEHFLSEYEKNKIDIKEVNKEMLIDSLTAVNNEKNLFEFYQALPPVVVINNSQIPPTSSSMMRYFIYIYLSPDKNEQKKTDILEKIQKLMFGPNITEDQKGLVENTIKNYETKEIFDNNNNPENKNYETEYSSIEFQGGNNKTKRRRTNKKIRSQKKIYNKFLPNYYVGTRKNQKKRSNKKFRSLRKRRSYKRV